MDRDAQRQPGQPDSPGLLAGLGALARNVLGLLGNRAELAVLELGEMRDNALRLLVMVALAIVALGFALACLTALIVVLAWPAMGWTILLLLTVVFGALAFGIAAYARALIAGGGLSMPATMAELRSDIDTLL